MQFPLSATVHVASALIFETFVTLSTVGTALEATEPETNLSNLSFAGRQSHRYFGSVVILLLKKIYLVRGSFSFKMRLLEEKTFFAILKSKDRQTIDGKNTKLQSLTKVMKHYQFRPYFIVIWTNFILFPHFSKPLPPINVVVCF